MDAWNGGRQTVSIQRIGKVARAVSDVLGEGSTVLCACDTVRGGWVHLEDHRMLGTEEVVLLANDLALDLDLLEDAWGNRFQFTLPVGATIRDIECLVVRSPGRDGKLDGASYEIRRFPFSDWDQDLVVVRNYFARWPSG